MRYAALLLLLSTVCFSETASDRELKLQRIYEQHAKASAMFGDTIQSMAEQTCADLHARAAEAILEKPSVALNVSKKVKTGCEELLRSARESNKKIADAKLTDSCLTLKQVAPTDLLSKHADSCRKVGIELIDPPPSTELADRCRPFVGKAYEDWPADCAPVSSGLREYLAAKR